MAFLELIDVHKTFGAGNAVESFSLAVERGEFVSFLGPSGCGKTTSLRMVAGFEAPTSGTIRIDGQDVTHLSTARRRIGMVFQAYALFPNMTVARNVAFGLRVAGIARPEIDRRVMEMLDLVKLAPLAARYPAQLSGGQQQRVALARALAPSPRILLLDEPLSALDAQIRVEMRAEIRALQQALGITTIFVTHDQEEALSLSDRIVVMHAGRIEQVGTPLEIYNAPRTRFVAGFVGTTNVLTARILDAAAGDIDIDGQRVCIARALGGTASQSRPVSLRPEALQVGTDLPCQLTGITEEVAFLGSIVRVRVRLDKQTVVIDQFNARHTPPPAVGQPVTLSFAAEDLNLLD